MQIVIDTKKDTQQELRKAIAFLQSLLDEAPAPTPDQEDVSGFVNIFADTSSTATTASPEKTEEADDQEDQPTKLELY